MYNLFWSVKTPSFRIKLKTIEILKLYLYSLGVLYFGKLSALEIVIKQFVLG